MDIDLTRVTEKRGRGARANYERDVKPHLNLVAQMQREGYTHLQICKVLGISKAAFYEMRNRHKEFDDTVVLARRTLIADLEDTLYRKALGKITTKDTKKYIQRDKSGKEVSRVEETIKEYPPDTYALTFALRNLAGHKWSLEPPKEDNKDTIKELAEALKNLGGIDEDK